MTTPLVQFIKDNHLDAHLLSALQTEGFVTSMAAAPHVIDPSEWLSFMWGGASSAPFKTPEELEQYAEIIVNLWNLKREALLTNAWQWPKECALSGETVNLETREFCEGLLQGWTLSREDWETLMPENSQDNALLGGVLLSISMLFDPEAALPMMQAQGAEELAQFAEIFDAMPVMLCGLTLRGAQLAEVGE